MEKKICIDCSIEKSVDDFYLNGSSKKTGRIYYTKRCRKCHNKKCVKRLQARCNKDPLVRLATNKKTRDWKLANPEKNRESVKRYWKKLKETNPEKYRKIKRETEKRSSKTNGYKKKKIRQWHRRREELRDGYVRKLLGGKKYNSLIPVKREQIKLIRLCKKLESKT